MVSKIVVDSHRTHCKQFGHCAPMKYATVTHVQSQVGKIKIFLSLFSSSVTVYLQKFQGKTYPNHVIHLFFFFYIYFYIYIYIIYIFVPELNLSLFHVVHMYTSSSIPFFFHFSEMFMIYNFYESLFYISCIHICCIPIVLSMKANRLFYIHRLLCKMYGTHP